VQLLQLNEVVFSASMRLADLGRVTLAFAPHFLVLALPLAYMLGIQLGVGRLAADRELLGLSSAGYSPRQLFRVPIAVAIVLVLADAGRIEDAGGEALRLHLDRGELHRMEPRGETVVRFNQGTFLVGVQERVARKNRFHGVEAALPYAELSARAEQYRKNGWMEDVARLRVEQGRRWAVPLACFCFGLLGVPLAVLAGGARGSAYLITLGSFVLFYVTSRLGLALAL